MVGPVPGISEHRLPTSVPRNIGAIVRRHSSREGRMSLSVTFAYLALTVDTWLTEFMNSPMPNRPSASAISSMPSSRWVFVLVLCFVFVLLLVLFLFCFCLFL